MAGLQNGGGVAAGETWNSGDTINGNGSTSVSLILNGGAAGSVVDANNISSINVNLVASSTLDNSEFTNVAAVNVTSGVAAQVLTANSASLSTVYGASIAGRNITQTINYASTTGSSDKAQLSVAGTGNATTDTTFNVATGNTIEAVSLATSGTNYVTVNGGTAAATYSVTGSGTNEITIGTAATTMTVDASATTGDNILNVGTLLSTTDSVKGGSGSDKLVANLTTGVQLIPTVSGVEELDLTFTSAAIYNASSTTGVETVDITPVGAVNASITNLAATATTINVGTSAAITATGTVGISYATGSDSDVTLNIGATSSTSNPAVSSTGAMTISNNVGALTINSVGDAANTLGAVTANRASSLTVAGVAQNLTAGALSATGASEVTIDGALKNTQVTSAAAASLTVDETLTSFTLTSGTGTAGLRNTGAGTESVVQTAANGTDIDVTYNITSGAARADIDDITITGGATAGDAIDASFVINGGAGVANAGILTVAGINTNRTGTVSTSLEASATQGAVGITTLSLVAAASAAAATVNLSADGGDVTLGTLNLANNDAAGGSTNSTTASITIEAVSDTDTATITSLDDVGAVTNVQGISTITATGAGTININAANAGLFANTSDTVINATGATGAVTINLGSSTAAADINVVLGNAASTSAGNNVTTGAGADVIVGGTGADVINAGSGADNVNGGSGVDNITGAVGADNLTGGAGADTFVYNTGNTPIVVTTQGGVAATEVFTLTINGNWSVGEVITFNDQNSAAGANTVAYTVVQGDTNSTIAIGILAAYVALTGETYTGARAANVITFTADAVGVRTDATSVVTTANTGVTLATADTITDFTTASDQIKAGFAGATGATIANGTAFVAGADSGFASFVTAADAVLAAGVGANNDIYAAWNVAGTGNAYVVVDRNDSGSVDQGDTLIVLTGVDTAAKIALADFIV